MFLTATEREKAEIRQEGREGSVQRAQTIAQTMLAQDFLVEQMADLTGLPLEQVLTLRNQPFAKAGNAEAA